MKKYTLSFNTLESGLPQVLSAIRKTFYEKDRSLISVTITKSTVKDRLDFDVVANDTFTLFRLAENQTKNV